jgi:hypothetical protein
VICTYVTDHGKKDLMEVINLITAGEFGINDDKAAMYLGI